MFPVSLLTAAFSELLILSLTPTFSHADLLPLSVKRSKHPIGGLSNDPHSSTHSPFHHPPIPLPYLLPRKHASFTELSLPCLMLILQPCPPGPLHPSFTHLLCCIFHLSLLIAPSCLPANVLQSLQPCQPLLQPRFFFNLQLLPYFLIPCTAKFSERVVYTSASLIQPSTHYAHHTWEMALGKQSKLSIAKFYVLVPALLLQFNTASHPLSIGQGPNRIQMAHTSLVAFPKLSHTSINSPFIHGGCCSRLEPAAERSYHK